MNSTSNDGHRQPLAIESLALDRLAKEIILPRVGREPSHTIGRGTDLDTVLPDPQVAERHCTILWHGKTQEYQVVDHQSQTGTFVNRQDVATAVLHSGDLIQIGPYAWTFNEIDHVLIRVGPINGMALRLRNVRVAARLQHVSLDLCRGEFVAIVGITGAGKSTLINTLIGDPRTPYEGDILVDGRNLRWETDWFRSQLGYVAQHDALRGDLTAEQTVALSARLRGVPTYSLEYILKLVEFPWGRRNALCQELSGGESKRLRLAAELVAEPRLLVLDEPGSGLDEGREMGMMRLLRQLTHRGCTVVMVTHNLRLLGHCSRAIAILKREVHNNGKVKELGEVAFDGAPAELLRYMPSGDFKELTPKFAEEGTDFSSHAEPVDCLSTRSTESGRTGQVIGRSFWYFLCFWIQFLQIGRREILLLTNSWHAFFRRLILPIAVLPSFFAISIGLSVSTTDRALLGFLSILACIWMGASLSLMAIVDEREAYNHERLTFLKILPYVTAKTVFLSGIAILQTTLFISLLSLSRHEWLTGKSDAMFFHLAKTAFCLAVITLSASGLGLVISAIVNRSRPAANFLLPLLMMSQIVFSVQVAGKGKDDLEIAYRDFQLFHEPIVDSDQQRAMPSSLVVIASYFTLSRYGDIVLRSFAYHQQSKPAYQMWQWDALRILGLSIFAFPVIVTTVLWLQEQY